jgi:hypothetical protein
MKNIQVVDGAVNCEFPIYAATNEEFGTIFPGLDQDLEIVEDFIARVGEDRADAILGAIWGRRINKKSALGIHGTLFYEKEEERAYFPASRREADWQTHTKASLANGS